MTDLAPTNKTKFYTYNQNNSGGGFDHDEVAGIGYMVIVEAYNVKQANALAESIGLYFDGYGDCPCCGNRWHEAWRDEGTDEPSSYGRPLDLSGEGNLNWGIPSYVHYLDGKILKISGQTRED